MSEITERLNVAIADRYVIERACPALKGGLGAQRAGVLKDIQRAPFRAFAARRAAPSRAFTPGTSRGGP
jgi:hypothetical protein